MKPERLLALYPRRWRRRYGAEMAEVLGHERLSAQLVLDLVRGAFDAHLHPELASPILAAAGGGTVQVPPRSPRVWTLVLAAVLLLFLVYGGLYAVRSQTPAMPQVPLTQAVAEVQAGQVSRIDIEDFRATMTLVDGTRQQVALGGQTQQDQLMATVTQHNQTDAAHRVQLLVQTPSGSDAFTQVLPMLLSVLLFTALPLALLALLVLLLARRLRGDRRDRRADRSRYEWLARIAEIRDRGVLTEEEFQREKRRLLDED